MQRAGLTHAPVVPSELVHVFAFVYYYLSRMHVQTRRMGSERVGETKIPSKRASAVITSLN